MAFWAWRSLRMRRASLFVLYRTKPTALGPVDVSRPGVCVALGRDSHIALFTAVHKLGRKRGDLSYRKRALSPSVCAA